MLQRTRTAIVGLAATLLLSACGGDDGGSSTGPGEAAGTVVATSEGAPGTFLTDADGMTLYLFTDDTPGTSTCTGDCLVAWPALVTAGTPVAGAGVDASLLGTTTRGDGAVQVTYGGWPLYRFAGDGAPGDLAGQGVSGVWFVVSPTGDMLMDGADADTTTGGSDGGAPAIDYSY